MRARNLLVQRIKCNELDHGGEKCEQKACDEPEVEHLGDLSVHHSFYLESSDAIVFDDFQISVALYSLAIARHTLV